MKERSVTFIYPPKDADIHIVTHYNPNMGRSWVDTRQSFVDAQLYASELRNLGNLDVRVSKFVCEAILEIK